jgi:ADP-heptose:LPS heptosyltransferase
LKAHRPDLRVAVLAEPRFAPIFEENPDIEAVLGESFGDIRRWRPDLTINFHGGTRSMQLTAFSGAKYLAGFAHHRYSFVYTHKIPRAQEILGEGRTVHTAEHLASAMFHLGVPLSEVPRARLVTRKEFKVPRRTKLPDYAVIHAFAAMPDKTWPLDRFLALAEHIEKSLALEPIFISGPGDSSNFTDRYAVIQNAPIASIKALMSGAQLFAGNDSGPAHMAAAYGVPCVVLFGSSNLDVWRPWKTESRAIKLPAGIQSIELATVIQAADELKPKVSA